ncbi:MAG: PHP domain-containing protein [Nanoarchaeota archaeon]|nr:PHP domain-containing protein [Nanoarchaeota archaeon]
MYFALHTHTSYSDGMKTPAEALQEAIQLGFSKYVITDHETTEAFFDSELETFMRLAGDTIELISGVELTTISEIPDSENAADIELVGLCFDLYAKPIKTVCYHNQEARRDWKRKTFEIINDFFGLKGATEMNDNFLEKCNMGKMKGSVAKPHFVNALLTHKHVLDWLGAIRKFDDLVEEEFQNIQTLRKEVKETMKAEIRREFYTEYLFSMLRSPNEISYSDLADENYSTLYIPKDFISLEEGITAIRESGGLIEIPHAFVSAKRIGMNVQEFLRLFEGPIKEGNIIGIEKDYPIIPKYRKYYKKYGKGMTTDLPKHYPERRDSDRFPTVGKDLTVEEMEKYANEDMGTRIYELEISLGLSVGTLIRFKVSDCHFKPGDSLLHFCSGETEYNHLMEAKRKL